MRPASGSMAAMSKKCAEEGCEADGVDGVAVGAGLGEEAWRLAVFGEAVQGARGAVNIYTEGRLLVTGV